MNPFLCLMSIVGGLCLLYIVYRVRMNMAIDGVFHNPSYQLGMVFAVVCALLVFGFTGLVAWLL